MVPSFLVPAMILLGLWCQTMVSPHRAYAQTGPEAESLARAREHFASGLNHLNARRWSEAAASFESALELKASAHVRFNLSTALSKMGRLREAQVQLELIRLDPAAGNRVRKAAQAAIDNNRSRLGLVAVAANREHEITTVSVDGQLAHPALWGEGIPVDPGVRDLTVTLVGAPALRHRLEVKPGESLRVHLLPAAVASRMPTETAAVAADPEPAEATRSPRWLWWSAGAAGLAVAGVAAWAVQRGQRDPVKGNAGHFDIGAP